MAEQHDAPDPQALLVLLDSLVEGLPDPADPRLRAEADQLWIRRRVLPTLDAGVRALVAEWERLATNGGVGSISPEAYERMNDLVTKCRRERDAARAENERLLEALRGVERVGLDLGKAGWSAEVYGGKKGSREWDAPRCPECAWDAPGHEPDCAVGLALAGGKEDAGG